VWLTRGSLSSSTLEDCFSNSSAAARFWAESASAIPALVDFDLLSDGVRNFFLGSVSYSAFSAVSSVYDVLHSLVFSLRNFLVGRLVTGEPAAGREEGSDEAEADELRDGFHKCVNN